MPTDHSTAKPIRRGQRWPRANLGTTLLIVSLAMLQLALARRAIAREQRARRDAEAANRAKDDLLSVLGHDLRNPLNVLVTSAEVLRCAPAGSAVAESARSVVVRQTRQLTMLVDRLRQADRAIADEGAPVLGPVDLQDIARATLARATPQALRRGHRLELEAPVPVWARGDPGRMAQVLAQALDQAMWNAAVGTTIKLRVDRCADDAVMSVCAIANRCEPGSAFEWRMRAIDPTPDR